MQGEEKKKSGPKSPFDPSLGIGVWGSMRKPQAILDLLKERKVNALLNELACDAHFKSELLKRYE